MLTRRTLFAAPALLVAPTVLARAPDRMRDLQQRGFRYFWDTTDPRTGLAPDRWPTRSVASIAATGFALTALPVGVANGWVARGAARDRALTTLRFLWSLPQGNAAEGMAGHRGFFYHFLETGTGRRARPCELSTVDTALLMAGVLFAGLWFDRADPAETEIRSLARRLYERVEWDWSADVAGDARPSMGWYPESGFIARRWNGYTEAMILYLLGLGSPTHPLPPAAWNAWCATYRDSWRDEGARRHLAGAPHFWHQYSHVWVDFRGRRDAAMRVAGFDYFENSVRATRTQRDYALANPGGWRGYDGEVWGLTACDGPGPITVRVAGRDHTLASYSARGPLGLPDGFDDGTIAPTAAAASFPFAPDMVEAAVAAMRQRHGAAIWDRYGFRDSFNLSAASAEGRPLEGRIIPGFGWVAADYLGIDQGPIVAMIENARSGMIWSTMRSQPDLQRGMRLAGFTDATV